MKIMVTGGAGFIGSHLIRKLIKLKQHKIINVDSLTYAANLENLIDVSENKNYFFEKVDICDTKKIAGCFKKYQPNVVIHLAAESHVDRSIDKPSQFIETNIIGTYKLLEAGLDYFESLSVADKKNFRFHHVSTDEVFGSLNLLDKPFLPESPYRPRSPYSASKAAADHLVMAWHHTFGLPIVMSNSSNNFGPFQYPEKLIPLIIIRAIAGKHLPVYGTGNNLRDWLYVEDHTDALIKIMTSGEIGKSYLVGSGSNVSNISVVRYICDLLDQSLPNSSYRPHKKLISFVEDRPGHDLRYALDSKHTINDLGWSPKHSFKQGLKKTVQWYINNMDWWAPLVESPSKLQRLGLTP